jgi:hypothetical protein
MALLLEVDGRRRLALGKLGDPSHTRYLAEEQPDGTIILDSRLRVATAPRRHYRPA